MMFSIIFLSIFMTAIKYKTKKNKREKRKKALLIARLSSKGQDTLKEQVQWMKGIVSSKNLRVVKLISDVCKGKDFPIKHREEIIKVADNEGIDVIVTFKIDRFARNAPHGIILLDDLNEKRKIKIISTEGEYEYSNPNDCFIVRFFLLLAEQEQGQRMDRVFLKISKMMENGIYPRKSVPLGYKRDGNNKLIPNVWCRKVINDIFDIFINIKDYSKTARAINKKYPKIINDGLTGAKIEGIIRNQIYIGYLHWGGELFGEGEDNKPRERLKVIDKKKFDEAEKIADQIWQRYSRDEYNILGNLADEYGLGPILTFMDYGVKCPNCGWFENEKNGKDINSELFQRKYICKNCRTEFRSPLMKQIKKIRKLVSMPCRNCGKKDKFVLLNDNSNMWQLRCENCGHIIFLYDYCDVANNESKPNKKARKNRRNERRNSNQIALNFKQ